MDLPRNSRSSLSQRSATQSGHRRRDDFVSLSQPAPSISGNGRKQHWAKGSCSQKSQEIPSDRLASGEENQLAGSLIRYLFMLDRAKQAIHKTRILKYVFDGRAQRFHRVIDRVRILLSEIFGYRLVELEGNKFILVNEIQNNLPHIYPSAKERSQQVLSFLVLTHIFMQNESCTEESLWDFLTNLDIPCSDDQCHGYFGNVKHLITEVFVTQKYLEKTVIEENESVKVEFKWGPRAEHEFSRRASLEFVSQIYNGHPLKSWPLQFKCLIAREKSNSKPAAKGNKSLPSERV